MIPRRKRALDLDDPMAFLWCHHVVEIFIFEKKISSNIANIANKFGTWWPEDES